MVPVKSIQKPFHDHPFHLYEGERFRRYDCSVKEHGVLNWLLHRSFLIPVAKCFPGIIAGMLLSSAGIKEPGDKD